MSKICLLSTLLLFIVSCKSFNGNLENHEDISFKTKKGLVVIHQGEREVELTFKSKKKAELEIAGKKVEFKFSSDLKIPANGNFVVKAANWNQDYDLVGNSLTNISVGPLSHEYESCIERMPYTICDRGGVCRVVYQDYHGRRYAEFRVETTSQNIEIDLEKNGIDHAKLTGRNVNFERRYEYIGPCR